MLADKNKLSKLQISLISAALATGLASATTVFAEDSTVSEKDMLTQAVALYEKLSGQEVVVPDALISNCGDKNLGKAVMLGFKNTDEAAYVSDAVAIRKQDALTILYKTILSYDYSYALTSDEIDEIMNNCYDNALVSEENRAAYAFMIKHEIIQGTYGTEPDKLITWSSCATLVDVLYDLFVQDVSFSVADGSVKIGANIAFVVDNFGQPQRIDKSDYDFDWYVYNSDPAKFMMVGVKENRVCAFFTNSDNFSFGDIAEGDDYLLAHSYMENADFRIFKNRDGEIDAVMYNPYTKSDVTLTNSTYLRACELIDIINVQRSKQGLDALNIDNELYVKAEDMVSQPKYHELARDNRYTHTMDGAQHEEGYDIFLIYQKLLDNAENECFGSKTSSVGISTYVDGAFNIYTSIVCSKSNAELTTQPADIETVSPETEVFVFETEADYDITDASTFVFDTEDTDSALAQAELVTPQIAAPLNETTIPAGNDLTIELTEKFADEYYVSVYSIEDDAYVVNSFIKTDSTTLSFPSDLFTAGKDYTVSVSSASSTATSAANEFTVRYGEAPENALTLVATDSAIVTDNDYIDVEWQTDLYSTFVLDVYNEEGKLMLSETINDTNKLTVNNIDPGTYYIYLTALRNGTQDVFKTQEMIVATVELPEPVITEYILEDGEKFYPVYEDEEMGLLYFYGEEIIDVEQISSNGKVVTAKKKKITEKQVKSVAYYKYLAQQQERVEFFLGSATPTLRDRSLETTVYNGTPMSLYDPTIGGAAVAEAQKYLGVPYVWGGTTPGGFDCSGLVQYVYNSLGITINRVSQDQFKQGAYVTREQLMPGDLVFFEDNGDVHHVGLYVGDGYMIHAPYTGAVVSYQSIDTPYYASQFCGGRRVY
ncbi:MAG: C40 family peptidase [Clostridia bacterium]|nr:C40 family peptidase [Clostridia bacterium]